METFGPDNSTSQRRIGRTVVIRGLCMLGIMMGIVPHCAAPEDNNGEQVDTGMAQDMGLDTHVDIVQDAVDLESPLDVTTGVDTGRAVIVEQCSNDLDDNGNGLIDCADPGCYQKPACVESICGDLQDNDDDSLVDCIDPDCASSTTCQKETCGSYFTCMTEQGCNCQVNVDCPAPETPEYGACQKNCAINQTCRSRCVNSLSLPMQQNLARLTACIDTYCPGGGGTCLFEYCVTEFAACYLTGTDTCHTFYFNCMDGCGASETCADACFSGLSPTGYTDLLKWRSCWLGLCDKNEEVGSDSTACTVVGSYVACLPKAGSCVTHSTQGTCAETATCILGCQSFTDNICVANCLTDPGVDVADVEPLSELFACVINTCGTTPEYLTPQCAQSVLLGGCSDVAKRCGL